MSRRKAKLIVLLVAVIFITLAFSTMKWYPYNLAFSAIGGTLLYKSI